MASATTWCGPVRPERRKSETGNGGTDHPGLLILRWCWKVMTWKMNTASAEAAWITPPFTLGGGSCGLNVLNCKADGRKGVVSVWVRIKTLFGNRRYPPNYSSLLDVPVPEHAGQGASRNYFWILRMFYPEMKRLPMKHKGRRLSGKAWGYWIGRSFLSRTRMGGRRPEMSIFQTPHPPLRAPSPRRRRYFQFLREWLKQ